MGVPGDSEVTLGLRRRLRLATVFLLLFLSYHVLGPIVGPILLDWPTSRGEARKEFCLAESLRYTSCLSRSR